MTILLKWPIIPRPGELLAEPLAVHARLPLEGKHAGDAYVLQPGNQQRHVAVGVHEERDVTLLEPRHELAVIGSEELLERLPRDHRAVVVRHVLGDGHERRRADAAESIDQVEVVVEQVLVDLVDQLGLVVEAQAEPLEAHQRARKPEEALERAPDDGLAPCLALGPGTHGLDGGLVAGKKARPDAAVIVHVRDDALDVMLDGLDGRLGGAEPELLVGVEAEVLGRCRRPGGMARSRGSPSSCQRAMVWSHHMAHSQRGSRSTGWKLMTARNRSTWFMAELAVQVAVVRDPTIRTAPPLSSAHHRADLHLDSTRCPGAEREENRELPM